MFDLRWPIEAIFICIESLNSGVASLTIYSNCCASIFVFINSKTYLKCFIFVEKSSSKIW